jgi:hypothetical protein
LLGAQTDFASFSASPLAFSAVHSGTSKADLQKRKVKGENKKQKPLDTRLPVPSPLQGEG